MGQKIKKKKSRPKSFWNEVNFNFTEYYVYFFFTSFFLFRLNFLKHFLTPLWSRTHSKSTLASAFGLKPFVHPRFPRRRRSLTLAFGITRLKPKWIQVANSSGCPSRDPGSTISFLVFIPNMLDAVIWDQWSVDSSSMRPIIKILDLWADTLSFNSCYSLCIISLLKVEVFLFTKWICSLPSWTTYQLQVLLLLLLLEQTSVPMGKWKL